MARQQSWRRWGTLQPVVGHAAAGCRWRDLVAAGRWGMVGWKDRFQVYDVVLVDIRRWPSFTHVANSVWGECDGLSRHTHEYSAGPSSAACRLDATRV